MKIKMIDKVKAQKTMKKTQTRVRNQSQEQGDLDDVSSCSIVCIVNACTSRSTNALRAHAKVEVK